jgi:polysaccharide export outer membrane protein
MKIEIRAASRRLATFAVLALALGSIACSSAKPAPQPMGQNAFPGPYRVGPPDQLLVSILPEPQIDRTVTVRPDGKISIDLVGDVDAAGRRPEEIAADIQTRISKYKRDASVTVSVAKADSIAITVLGEVRAPKVFPLARETRVVEALGEVGGPSFFASTSKIRVVRPGEPTPAVFLVNLDDITEGDLSTNIQLNGGDIVYVEPTVFAKIGYALQQVLFPFQQIIGGGGAMAAFAMGGNVAGGGIRP